VVEMEEGSGGLGSTVRKRRLIVYDKTRHWF
jgi:hypothetical protein